jgi:E3 ubiquitin-protein ligase NEDD4
MNPNSGIANEFHLRYFHMAGRVLGKALMDGQITPVHLIQPLYKHLMGWPVTLRDLEHVDDQVYRNLWSLLDLDDVGMLYLEFVVTEDHLGVAETVELVPGGADMTVDNKNLPEYLIAQLHYRLMNRTRPQLTEFLKGFYDVVPEPLLSVFDFQQVELLLHGLPNIDMDDWIRNTEYTGEFQGSSSHKVAQWFWEIVRGYEQEQRAKLLQFVTGTAGVPVQGFGFLQGNDGNIRKFTLHGDKNVKVFPRAHTCFNRIDMPIYKSKAEMNKFLTMAISMESTGFDIE